MTLDKNSAIKKVMFLKTTIEDAARSALKNHEPELLSTLRMLLSAMHNREIEKRTRLSKGEATADPEKSFELNNEEIIEVIRSESKKRREAMVEYAKAGRKESAEKETLELTILEKYLPQELRDEEIEKIVREVVANFGSVIDKDFGKVMGEVMKRLKGQVSGDRVSVSVRKFLGK